MKTQLEQLVDVGVISNKVVKPFKDWVNSSQKGTEIELRILDVGENLEIAQTVDGDGFLSQVIKSKIEILARSVVKVNGTDPVTQEDLERYNKDNKLEGTNKIGFVNYKKNIISRWSLPVLNRLNEEYTELLDDQVELLTGVRPRRDENVKSQLEPVTVPGTS